MALPPDAVPINKMPDDAVPINRITRKEDIPQLPHSPFSATLQPNYEGVMGAMGALEKPLIPAQSILSSPAGRMGASAVSNVGINPFLGALTPPQYREQVGANLLSEQTTPLNLGLMALPMKMGLDPVIAPARNDIAGALINSLIKPRDAEFRYHNNPGMVVAKEGLFANTLKGLSDVIGKRISEVQQKKLLAMTGIDHADKKFDLLDTLTPVLETTSELQKAPKSNSAAIKRITDHYEDFLEWAKQEDLDLSEVTPEQADKVKDFIDGFIDWNKSEKSDVAINKAFKQSYHNIDKKIDKAIPEVKEYNDRIRGLYDARKATARRINAEQRRGLMGLGDIPQTLLGGVLGGGAGGVAGFLAGRVAESPTFKTSLAKLLATKYPALSVK